MTRFSFSSLRVRLLLLVLLAVVPAFGLMLYNHLEQRQLATAQTRHNMLQVARLAASHNHDLIEGVHQLLVTLARLPQVRGANPAACSVLFADLLKQHRGYSNLGVIMPNGDVFCSGLPLRGPTNLADRAYFQRALETRDFAIGEYQVGRITGNATVNFGYPVLDEAGRIQAVVFAALDLAWLNRFAREAQLPLGSTLTVIDRNGTILAAYPDPEKWVGQSAAEAPVGRIILTQHEGTTEAPGLDGVPGLVGFTPLDRAPVSGYVYVSISTPRKLAFAEADRMLARNLAWLGIFTLMVLVSTRIAAGLLMLRPVEALISMTKRLALGDLGARSGLPYRPGELNQLARAFDEMAQALEKATVQLEATVEDRTRELKAANVRLEEVSRHKSEFLANMSHELRTPLNSVIGFSDLLLEQTTGQLNAKQTRFLTNIQNSGKHLVQLISDILDLSKVEAGKVVLQVEPLPVAMTLEDILVIARGLAYKKRQTVETQIDPDLPPLQADPLRFKQILFNLLSNAIKFTPDGGRVIVTARRVPGSTFHVPSSGTATEVAQPGTWNPEPGTPQSLDFIEIAVADTGIGIKAEDLPRLFQEFVQLEATATQHAEGTGLGLALTRRLVELHGGRIWAESPGEGRGSTFTVVLPFGGPGEVPES